MVNEELKTIVKYNQDETMLENKYINLTIKGLSNIEHLKETLEKNKEKGGTLLITYDQMQYIDQTMVSIFTVYSHHYNVTWLSPTQSLFLSNKVYGTISLNSNYLVLMKNTRDSSSDTQLAKDTHPFRTGFVTAACVDATKNSYTYPLFDLRQETVDEIMVRGKIFCDPLTVYIPK